MKKEIIMLEMSIYNGTLNREVLKDFIQKTNKPIKYTFGHKYKNPSTLNVPINKEQAIKIAETAGLLDATEHEGYLGLNAYGGNDMW